MGPGPGPQPPAAIHCPQCGFYHPPIASNARCPMAKEKTENGDIIDFEKFWTNLKVMLVTFIKINKIKDPNKFLTWLTARISKILGVINIKTGEVINGENNSK
jgi:hypothetical protein